MTCKFTVMNLAPNMWSVCSFFTVNQPVDWGSNIFLITRCAKHLIYTDVLEQCDQIYINFAILATFLKVFGRLLRVYLVFGKILSILWQTVDAFGQTFTAVNGQILNKTNSHLVTLFRRYASFGLPGWFTRLSSHTTFVI